MEKKKILCIISLAIFILFSRGIYLFALDRNVILSELKRLKIKVTGSAKQIEAQLPIKLSGADWGLKKIVCEQGGYDLSAYAGKKVSLIRFPISEKYASEPLNVWVVSCNDKIACVYKAVREGSNLVPGVFPIENLKANEQFK